MSQMPHGRNFNSIHKVECKYVCGQLIPLPVTSPLQSPPLDPTASPDSGVGQVAPLGGWIQVERKRAMIREGYPAYGPGPIPGRRSDSGDDSGAGVCGARRPRYGTVPRPRPAWTTPGPGTRTVPCC
eukprot:767595-Hanusia_phi.AAC.2